MSDKSKGAKAWEDWYAYQKAVTVWYLFLLLMNDDFLSVKYQEDESEVDDIAITFKNNSKQYIQCKKNWQKTDLDWGFSEKDKMKILLEMYKQYIKDTNNFTEKTNNKYVLISHNNSKHILDIVNAIKDSKALKQKIEERSLNLNKKANAFYKDFFNEVKKIQLPKSSYIEKEGASPYEQIEELSKVYIDQEQYDNFWYQIDCISFDKKILEPSLNIYSRAIFWGDTNKYLNTCNIIIWKLSPRESRENTRYRKEIYKEDMTKLIESIYPVK